MTDSAGGRFPTGSLGKNREVQQATELLKSLQDMLMLLGRGEHRNSPNYQRLLAQYKHLGAELHKARQELASTVPVMPAGPGGRPAVSQKPGAPYTRPLGQHPAPAVP